MRIILQLVKLAIVFQIISFISCKSYTFEIKRPSKDNDLQAMKQKWDYHIEKSLNINKKSNKKQQSSTSNNFYNNNNESSYKSKLLSNLRLNTNANTNSTTKPEHGNYTSFPLYTTYGNAYLVSIYIGSQSQEFQVLLDTGSSYTWLTHRNCTTCSELGINKFFDCEKSTTCANQHEKIELQYGQGSAQAIVYRDKIGFQHNKFIAQNQDFLLVTKLEDLQFFPGHGLFGLGFASLSDGRKTILDNLKEQGEINKRQFAFSLSGDAESIDFGMTNQDFFILGGDAIDPNLADENEFFTCPVTMKPYWSVDVASISPIISDVEINLHFSAKKAIIDSGTSFIVFNSNDFEVYVKFFKKLQKLSCSLDEKYNLLKCDALDHSVYPIFKFTLCEQSRHILVYPQQYLICDILNCYIRIAGLEPSLYMSDVIILGDIFMRTQYTIFNQDEMNISFYKKKNQKSDTEPPSLKIDNLETEVRFENSMNKSYSNTTTTTTTKKSKKFKNLKKDNLDENNSHQKKEIIHHNK